jgi:hypothetical protein
MVPWVERPTLQFDCAQTWQQQLAAVPVEAIAAARALLAVVAAEIPRRYLGLAHALRVRTANRFHAEIRAIADSIAIDWRVLAMANLSYEFVLTRYGCSVAALATSQGPVLARNMDWWPEDLLARASYLLRFERQGHHRWTAAGWPGATSVVTGLSARGFAISLNAVTSPEGINRLGYPVMLHLRRVLEDCGGFDEALSRLARTRLTAAALFTLVGTENHQRVIVERTPTRHALRWATGDQPLVVTNDFRSLQVRAAGPAALLNTACGRFDALTRFAATTDSAATRDEALLFALTDATVQQTITAQHVIVRPRQQQIRLFVPRRLLPSAARTGEGQTDAGT